MNNYNFREFLVVVEYCYDRTDGSICTFTCEPHLNFFIPNVGDDIRIIDASRQILDVNVEDVKTVIDIENKKAYHTITVHDA